MMKGKVLKPPFGLRSSGCLIVSSSSVGGLSIRFFSATRLNVSPCINYQEPEKERNRRLRDIVKTVLRDTQNSESWLVA